MILKRDQLFRVVCSILTPTTGGKAKIGTGSFIIYSPFLLRRAFHKNTGGLHDPQS